MSLGITKDDIEFLKELQHEMLTQDHVSQAAPRFWVVRGTVREYGIQDGWCDGESIRIDCESCIDTMEEAYEHLIEYYSKIPYKYCKDKDIVSYYDDTREEWIELINLEDVCEFLKENGNDEAEIIGHREVEKIYENTMFLTNRECKAHIKANHYHYPKDAHSYAMTAWRAPEVARLWNILDKINWDEVEKLAK